MTDPEFSTALAAFHDQRFDDAAAAARTALSAEPDSVRWATMLAMAEHSSGRFDKAADAFALLTRLRPNVPEYWTNLGNMLRLSGRHADAEAAFVAASALAPNAYGTVLNYGLLLLDMHRYGAARHRLLDAVELDPYQLEARIYAALACFECGDTDRAEALLPDPSAWPTLDPDLRYHLALVLMQLGHVEAADSLLQSAAASDVDTKTLASLAVLCERTNRLDKAEMLLQRIRVHPDHATRSARVDELQVQSLLSMRRRDYEGARACSTELLGLVSSPMAEASACYTMAAIEDKQNNPEAAMHMLGRAHAIHYRFAVEIMPELAEPGREPLQVALERATETQCRALAKPQPPVRTPVFIVGFPRSGTTMLEQMLDAHPALVSMDEQPLLSRSVDRLKRFGIGSQLDAGRLDEVQLEDLRAQYWEDVSHITHLTPDQTLVDKNPLNMLRLPMIRLLFPGARIIMALRHPCDVLLSCYMQDFRSPVFRVLCASLERLASSYQNAMAFWIHHQNMLDVDVLALRYEDTVSDFPRQVAKIGDFLGITDSGFLADFAAHARRKGFIGTPSYSQVVEPVNTRAVGRWERYRPWFETVLPQLEPIARHWGYALES